MLALDARHAIVVCADCGQRRLEPQLQQDELEAVYSGAYFRSTAPLGSSAALDGVAAPPADYGTEVVTSRRDKFIKTVNTIKMLSPGARKLLDVGAATGEFVRVAREHGFDAEGIEFSQFAVEQARRLNAVQLRRLRLADVPGSEIYDAIHLNHVFEHFNDPLAELAHIRRLLRRSGMLYLEVPYQFNVVERLKHSLHPERATLTLHSLHHAYFYRPRLLSRLVGANGFEVRLLSVFDPERYSVRSASDGAKLLMWRALALLGIGNHIELYAIRT
jgi:SAM-dependent methyltransferase